MDFQPKIDGTGDEIEELTLAAQKFIENVGEANSLEDIELDGECRFAKAVTVEGGSLISEGSLKRGHEDRDERNGPGAEAEKGGYSKMQRELS
jgi:hypothetical protein